MLFVVLSPTGPYFRTGAKPLSILAYGGSARTWPNGTGNFKLGINYPSAFQVQEEARKIGYDQILWLVRDEKSEPETAKVTEAGSMNFFVIVQRDDGGKSQSLRSRRLSVLMTTRP
jgi:branched-chain amino acid aminotransferase